MSKNNIIYHDTDLWHEKGEIVSQEQAAIAKRRIEELKRKNTSVYIGQPEAKQSDDECYNEIALAGKKFINEPVDKTEQELARTLEKHNLRLYCYPASETSEFTDAQSAVARMAFNGYVDRYRDNDLSKTFCGMKNNPAKRADTKPDDYNLDYASVWNVFKKIPEFAAIEDKVKKGLSSYGIPPENLPELNYKDFCFIINEQMRSSGSGGATRVFKESRKARNTKRFIEENEEEFRAGLLAMPGVKKEYVKMLIRAMKEGRTDLTEYKIDGKPVWKAEWANQPVINVHHIVNVKDSHSIDDWTKVNDYENMCFIVTHPQHDAMHSLEQDLQGHYHNDVFTNREIGKGMYYRVQPPEGVRCMLGFHNMIYDRKFLGLSEKEKAEIRQNAPNNKNHVSGNNYWRGHPSKDPYAMRKGWNQERMDYVRR